MRIHTRLLKTSFIAIIGCSLALGGCRKPNPDDVTYGVFLPSFVHVEYEAKDGHQDSGIYIRIENKVYVQHERSAGGKAEFFSIEQDNVGYDDGAGVIQDYICFRLLANAWLRAGNWSDNINYYGLVGGGSWSPYQSGTVRGPLYYLTQGVKMLNNKAESHTVKPNENIGIAGGIFDCLVYTTQEPYTSTSGPKVATTKYWIEKNTFLLFKSATSYDADEDINDEEFVTFQVTKYFTGASITLPAGVPQSSNG